MQKLPGVESVEVSLDRATTKLELRADNVITLQQLRSIIRNNGFTPKEAIVTVVGSLIDRAGQPALQVTGTSSVLAIVMDPKQPTAFKAVLDRLHRRSSAALRLVGVVEPGADQVDRIAVQVVSDERP